MHDLMVGVVTPFTSGVNSLKKALKQGHRFLKYTTISTCYATLENDQHTHYSAVARAQTELGLDEMMAEIKLEELRMAQKANILVLSYENLVRLDPEMTLPHPFLAQDSTLLQAASEVWGHFVHPVLKRTIDELRNEQPVQSEFDFVLSGRELQRSLK